MNQPLYTDLLNAALVLVAQKNNRTKIQELKNEIAERSQTYKLLVNDKPSGPKGKKGWGIVLLIISMFWLTYVVPVTSVGILFYLISVPIAIVVNLCGGLLVTIAGVSKSKLLKEHKEVVEDIREQNEDQTQADLAEIERLEADIATLQEGANELLAFLPETYHNAEAACYMLLAVKDGRADTLKEAMNLYEEQLHRWNMEKLAANSARMQQIYMESMQSAMREIADHQEQIQGQLSAIAGMQAMEMWRNA